MTSQLKAAGPLCRLFLAVYETLKDALVAPLHGADPQRVAAHRLVLVPLTDSNAIFEPLHAGLLQVATTGSATAAVTALERHRLAFIDHGVNGLNSDAEHIDHVDADVVLTAPYAVC